MIKILNKKLQIELLFLHCIDFAIQINYMILCKIITFFNNYYLLQ